MSEKQLWAKTVQMAGTEVSQIAFGTEHINQYLPEFSGKILRDAALKHHVFFWDTDNCYGSQPAVAAGLKMLPRDKVVVTSKTYADSEEDAYESVKKILHDLDTPYLDFCLLHGVEKGRLPYKKPAIRALKQMKKEGLLHHIGLSTHYPSVAWEASEVEEIEVLCTIFNKMGYWLDEGTVDQMAKALDKAHNRRKIGTYVIKTLGRGSLLKDIRGALNWVLDYHDFIDVYNIGYAGLRELRQDLSVVNDYFSRLEGDTQDA
ncbi:MAG: aldo/keto reductase [Lachnospiraceae bacterium]|jgi:aryl-alcohol dehydrogenase-like predicted oxidoreductase|nr:aldo/keto reductase [Lachnospiraceae bacterium]